LKPGMFHVERLVGGLLGLTILPEPGARSPEPGARSPEPGARSPEPGARSPEGCRRALLHHPSSEQGNPQPLLAPARCVEE
jgi:hypothetical protein